MFSYGIGTFATKSSSFLMKAPFFFNVFFNLSARKSLKTNNKSERVKTLHLNLFFLGICSKRRNGCNQSAVI